MLMREKKGADLLAQAAGLGVNAEGAKVVCLEAGTGIAEVPYNAAQHGCQHADLLCEAGDAPVCISILHVSIIISGSHCLSWGSWPFLAALPPTATRRFMQPVIGLGFVCPTAYLYIHCASRQPCRAHICT